MDSIVLRRCGQKDMRIISLLAKHALDGTVACELVADITLEGEDAELGANLHVLHNRCHLVARAHKAPETGLFNGSQNESGLLAGIRRKSAASYKARPRDLRHRLDEHDARNDRIARKVPLEEIVLLLGVCIFAYRASLISRDERIDKKERRTVRQKFDARLVVCVL